MADEQKVKIIITGDASGMIAEAGKLAAALKSVGSGNQSHKETAEALKRIGTDAKGMAAETVAAAEKGKRFGGHLADMKKIAGELSQEFPVAGMALRAFLNPLGAAATLAVGTFVAAKQAIADYLDLFKELPNATTTWMEKLQAWRKATLDGAQAWRDYEKAFRAALNPKETTSSKADKEVESIKEGAAKKIADLGRQSRVADAADNAAVASGKMTPEQAAYRKAQREVSVGSMTDKLNAGAVIQENDVRVREAKRLADELPLQDAAAKQKLTEARAAAQADADAKLREKLAMTRYGNADAAALAAGEKVAGLEGDSTWQKLTGMDAVRYFQRNAARGQRDRALSARQAAEDDLFQGLGISDRAGVAAASARGAASAATGEAIGTAGALTGVRGTLSEIRSRAEEMGKDQAAGAIIRAMQSQGAFNAQMKAATEAFQRQLDQFAAQSRQ